MRDQDLWARIDRVLEQCDARQLPPLTVYEPAVHLTRELAELRWPEPAKPDPPTRRRFSWPWRRP